MPPSKITGIQIKDIRFPTSLEKDGSDAMHSAPDYSAPYVILDTDGDIEGHGMTFTLGKGSELAWEPRLLLCLCCHRNRHRLNRSWSHLYCRQGNRHRGQSIWNQTCNLPYLAVHVIPWGWLIQHTAPDYSCAYVIVETDDLLQGHGHTFTCGRGTEIVCYAINTMTKMVVGRKLADIFNNFGDYWRELTSDDQARWVGPEKGVVHLATAAIINALWDLWAKMEGKPLWKLLVDMPAEQLANTIDFRYLSDLLTKDEAIAMLKEMDNGKAEREAEIYKTGYPIYITSCGWLGYSDEKITKLANEAMAQGFSRFKMKVGKDLEDDIRRAKIFRKVIGYDRIWCVDANQKWDVQESIDWMTALAPYKPLWIEEPTSPDDVLGHAAIAKALNPLGVGVATGEMCQNRVMFKQFLQANALQFCQIDSCRIGGPNEILAVYLMAKKMNVPVCPHAGGVGLCELVQHYSMFDYIRCAGTLHNRMTEYADHLHEHMMDPVRVENGCFKPPQAAGFLVGIKPESLKDYEYPCGRVWQKLFADGIFEKE